MVIALAVMGTSLLFWIIGFACGVSKSDPFPCQYWDYESKAAKLSLLESQLFYLQQEQKRLARYPPCHTHTRSEGVCKNSRRAGDC